MHLLTTQNKIDTKDSKFDISSNSRIAFEDTFVYGNSANMGTPTVTMSSLPSSVKPGLASRGIAADMASTVVRSINKSDTNSIYNGSIEITPGSTQFCRHKIFYSTKRGNKYGLPSKHSLLVKEPITSNSRIFKEMFGNSSIIPNLLELKVLITFLDHIRKNFSQCEVLKCLSRKCPIKIKTFNIDKKRLCKDLEFTDGDLIFNQIMKVCTKNEEVSSSMSNNYNSSCSSSTDSRSNLNESKKYFNANNHISSASTAGTKRKNEISSENQDQDENQKKRTSADHWKVDPKISYKKTKRGCRSGKNKCFRNSFIQSSSGRMKEFSHTSRSGYLNEDQVKKSLEKFVTFAEEIVNTKYGNGEGRSVKVFALYFMCIIQIPFISMVLEMYLKEIDRL